MLTCPIFQTKSLYYYYLLPMSISLVDFELVPDDKKSDKPTVANPIIMVNMPNQ